MANNGQATVLGIPILETSGEVNMVVINMTAGVLLVQHQAHPKCWLTLYCIRPVLLAYIIRIRINLEFRKNSPHFLTLKHLIWRLLMCYYINKGNHVQKIKYKSEYSLLKCILKKIHQHSLCVSIYQVETRIVTIVINDSPTRHRIFPATREIVTSCMGIIGCITVYWATVRIVLV